MPGSSTNSADLFSQFQSPLNAGIESSSNFLQPDPLRSSLELSAYSDRSSFTPESFNQTLSAVPTFDFTSGYFTVGTSGQVGVDYLFDGGSYQGELGIFSLSGLEQFDPGSNAFTQEVVRRILSSTTQGHLMIDDHAAAARFTDESGWEGNFNSGDYLGVKTVAMNPGDTFGVALLPHGSFRQILGNTDLWGNQRPLFSLATANPNQAFQFGQIADVTGNGSTFVLEDLSLDGYSDRDYNDIIFQVRGAIGSAASLDDVINPGNDWRSTPIWQQIVEITEPATPISSVIQFTPEMGFLETPIEISEGFWFLGGRSPDELNLKGYSSNLDAADTTNADQLWRGGALGLNLDGSGVTVGVWDGGRVLGTHQEFSGRVSDGDSSNFNNHATHVAGTIAATGVDPSARGMANRVNIKSFDWNNDLQEMRNAAQNGIPLSNHSYSHVAGWALGSWNEAFNQIPSNGSDFYVWFGDRSLATEDARFGKYSQEASNLDAILSQNPSLLSIWSAGNDRGSAFNQMNRVNALGVTEPFTGQSSYVTYFSKNVGIPGWQGNGWYRVPSSGMTFAPSADGGTDGYDLLSDMQTAKNTLVVGAINSITQDPYTRSHVSISNFSSFGLADDGRLKVDVVADGVGVYSPIASSNNSYASYSGTSMAAPNVTGTAALLTQHFKNLFGRTPSSATLKATLLHTARDAGNVGPDYIHGWGVVDGAAAAQFLDKAKQSVSAKLVENTYAGSAQAHQVSSTGNEPLKATIVWTDPPGVAHGNGLDETTRALVNDLDIWVTAPNGNILRPWTLNPSNPSAPAVRTARNSVDNVEQVLIDNPLPGTIPV